MYVHFWISLYLCIYRYEKCTYRYTYWTLAFCSTSAVARLSIKSLAPSIHYPATVLPIDALRTLHGGLCVAAGVNLPACQLMVAMGISLDRIPGPAAAYLTTVCGAVLVGTHSCRHCVRGRCGYLFV
jgi:hypothetical protein